MLAAVAVAFGMIGYAYTASTENSGNTLTSEYVVLSQQTYTFTDGDGVIVDTVTSKAGTVYQIHKGGKPVTDLFTYENRHYYGVPVGTDTLRADAVGIAPNTVLKVFTETFFTENQGVISTGFSDYSGTSIDWRYILKIEVTDQEDSATVTAKDVPTTQYLYYDGHSTPVDDRILWTVLEWDQENGVYVTSQNEYISMVEGITYNTTLYLAGIGQKTGDGSFFRFIGDKVTVTDDISMESVWVLGTNSDLRNILYKEQGSDEVRYIYVTPNTELVMPGNVFPPDDGKVFVGWFNASTQRIYYPGYVFQNFSEEMTFVAQWENTGDIDNYSTITLKESDSDSQPILNYVRKNQSYILPMNTYQLSKKVFVGWKLEGGENEVYQPGDEFRGVVSGKTFVAQWEDVDSTYKSVSLKGMVRGNSVTFESYVKENSTYIIPGFEFEPDYVLPEGEGWKFQGWSVTIGDSKPGTTVPQSYSQPNQMGYMIIENGAIKFSYDSSYNQQVPESEP